METFGSWVVVFRQFAELIQKLVRHTAASPPSLGYEAWLVEHGNGRVLARMMARLTVHSGERRARDARRFTEVARAIRFLARPRHQRSAVLRNVALLLGAWDESSIIESIFGEAGLDDLEFVQALRSAATDENELRHVVAIAAVLVPHLRSRPGPRVTAASAAHEFFLEHAVMAIEPRAYTWSPYTDDYSDPATEATRREFQSPDFDPRPANRRLKQRGQLCSRAPNRRLRK